MRQCFSSLVSPPDNILQIFLPFKSVILSSFGSFPPACLLRDLSSSVLVEHSCAISPAHRAFREGGDALLPLRPIAISGETFYRNLLT